jgi:ATP-dependent helicase STH1/SNF2
MKGLDNESIQLRKIRQHPFLFESIENKLSPGGGQNRHWQMIWKG